MTRKITTILTSVVLAVQLLFVPAASALSSSSSLRRYSPPVQNTYAALGDSIAAGVGLTGSNQSPPCRRSVEAYGYTVAQTLNLPLQHLACSGAKVSDLFTEQQAANGATIPAQIDTAFANGVPRVISVTAAANDVHWTDVLSKCFTSTCGTSSDRAMFDASVAAMAAKYYVAMSDIQWRSGHHAPKVVLTGYYVPLSANCAAVLPQLTPDELSWLAGNVRKVNLAIQAVARSYSFTKYAPVDFSGHDICSADSWVQGLSSTDPFHPTAVGQQDIAAAVIRALGY